MIQTRVIPVLLFKNGGLYKGISFKRHTYVGDPINTVKIFNEKEVDELLIIDIEASLRNTSLQYDFIEDIVSEAFMPVAYGGGINSIDVARNIFRLGVEKLIINSAGYTNLELISEIAEIFGSQSAVVSIDVKKGLLGDYRLYSHSGTRKEGPPLVEYIGQVEAAGAGEIIISNIVHDGQMTGYDLDLIATVSSQVGIPVIASCGAGTLSDFKAAVHAGATAVAAGSMFVFHGPHRAVLISYPNMDELKELWKN